MKKIYCLLIIATTFLSNLVYAQVSITASAGIPGPTTYATFKAAFDAINAGNHQGAIIINIDASTIEGTTPATLNSSDAAPAAYTSVLIRPTADGLTVSGNPATGFGVIQLKGADNVTIDGDNPNTTGTNRNLTVRNTNTATAIANSVVRIATATTVTSADNNTIKNCNLYGNVTNGNASGIIATTSSSNSSFGIYAGGNGGTTATDAPTAITSVSSQIIPAGATVNNLLIDNNSINQTARGIEFNGAATANSTGITITNNLIGNPTAGAITGVYSIGLTVQGSSFVNISRNTIYVESYVAAGLRAIDIGSINVNVTGVIVEKNVVGRVLASSPVGVGAYGINYAGGINSVIRNNFIYSISNFPNAAFSPTSGTFGIRLAANTGHKLLHNSVHLTGALSSTGTELTACLSIVSTSITGCDVRNNIFSNVMTGGNVGTAHVNIYLPSAATSSLNININNNAYYSGSASGLQGIAHAGTTYTSPVTTSGVGLYEAANFNAAATTPVTNLRNYTSTLSTAGTNDNASFAATTAAPFTSNTDLHINTGSAGSAALDNTGFSVGVTTDIDNQARNAATPDIGADEFTIAVVAVGVEYFRGSKAGTANYLDWKVNCSSDPSVRLILERSADSKTFTSIQDQNVSAARCAQGFNFTDASPLAGINYYRLKTISPDGAFRYSLIVALINKDKGFELISVAPNPVRTNTVLSISSVKAGKMSIAVSDMTGKVVMTQNINVIAGNNPIPMNFATLGAGTYNIRVINAENEVKATRFVKY